MRVLANFPELRWPPEKVNRRIAKSFVCCDKECFPLILCSSRVAERMH